MFEKSHKRRSLAKTEGTIYIPALSDRNDFKLYPPCLYNSQGNCMNCRKISVSSDEFNQRVVYQAFKIDRNYRRRKKNKGRAYRSRGNGIIPLDYSPISQINAATDNEKKMNDSRIKYNCEFLNNWILGIESCKFLALITMQNEQAEDLHITLEGVLDNLEKFIVTGSEKLKITANQFGCVIIVDGIDPFLKAYNKLDILKLSSKQCFRSNKTYYSQFFNPDLIKDEFLITDILKRSKKFSAEDEFDILLSLRESNLISESDNILHCFSQQIPYQSNFLNLLFCIKQESRRKLDSHHWFFEGFCSKIKPKYVMFLEAGAKPRKDSLYQLYKAMERDTRVAGCCGEIIPKGSGCNQLVQAQIVEYKFSHILDKAMESVIGYSSVLPSNFSAYRWERINSQPTIRNYFRFQLEKESTLFEANISQADDRILCLELIYQQDKSNILKYVSQATAEIKVPSTLSELMVQRRRWINGAWFSMVYTIQNCNRMAKTNHSFLRACCIRGLMIYYAIIAFFNWVLVGAFYIAFNIAIKRNLDEESNAIDPLTKRSTPVLILYVSVLILLIISSLGVEPRKLEGLYRFISIILGLYTYATTALILLFMFRNGVSTSYSTSQLSIGLLASGVGMFTIIIILNLRNAFWPVIRGILAFVFYMGSYVNLLMIDAICNTHDCSWGRRPGRPDSHEKSMDKEYRTVRSRWLVAWVFSNCGLAYAVNYVGGGGGSDSTLYINILAMITFGIVGVRFVGGLLYVFDELFCCCFHKKEEKNP